MNPAAVTTTNDGWETAPRDVLLESMGPHCTNRPYVWPTASAAAAPAIECVEGDERDVRELDILRAMVVRLGVELGEYFRRLREARDLTQMQLVFLCPTLTLHKVRLIEAGRIYIDTNEIRHLLRFYEVPDRASRHLTTLNRAIRELFAEAGLNEERAALLADGLAMPEPAVPSPRRRQPDPHRQPGRAVPGRRAKDVWVRAGMGDYE